MIPPAKMEMYPLGVQATRGCPHRCGFCCVQNVEGSRVRKRPIEDVIEEIKSIKSSFFFFADASLTIDPEYTKALFQEMQGLNKHFECFGNLDVLDEDEELLRMSKDAGCTSWLIGFESISQQNLDSVDKKTNKVKQYSAAVKKIRKYGILVKGSFIFGFDYDTPRIFHDTLKAVYEWKIDMAVFLILTPFPGTPLFNMFEKEGRILTKDWSKYDYGHVVFEPKNMSKDELWHKTRFVAKEFFSISNAARRVLDNPCFSFCNFKNKVINNFLINRYLNKRDFGF